MFKKITLTSLILLSLTACKGRDELLNVEEDKVSFSENKMVYLPNITNSEKRSTADLNCDGIDDMIEINDESSFFSFDEKYEMKFYEAYLDKEKIKHYKNSKTIQIDIDLSMFSDGLKIDTADINGDQCDDIVFTSLISKNSKETKLNLQIAVNQGNLTFIPSISNLELKNSGERDFTFWLNDLVSEIRYSEDESISDYVKMDWADFDGNGTDDLAIFVRDYYSVDIGIFMTEYIGGIQPYFSSLENYFLENVLIGATISRMDTGDLNGDGLADLLFPFNVRGEKIKTGFALNDGDGFKINSDKTNFFNVKTDIISKVTKRDTTDENNDGKDDLIYITEINDKPVKMVFYSTSQ